MAGSWGNGLKTPVNDLLHKNFKLQPLFGYHNFQNQINTWETTVPRVQDGDEGFAGRKKIISPTRKYKRPQEKFS